MRRIMRRNRALLTRRVFGLAAVAAALSAPAILRAGMPARYEIADLKALEHAFVDLAAEVRPSVVAIRCYQVHHSESTEGPKVKLPVSQGSGLVIDADGNIATNNHVIEDADMIAVVLHDGRQFEADLRGVDTRSDLAVLHIDATGLKPVRFGDLSLVRVNQWTFACGNPFGLAFDNNGRTSITYGVVSALGRQMTHRLTGDPDHHYYGNLIETSSTINPGNSGGPLFNVHGEAIGVVTAIETSSGVNEGHGFAIPVDKNTRRIFETLKSGQAVRYGFIGIEVNDVEPVAAKRATDEQTVRGARVARVRSPNGPAALAGLKAKDIIVEFDGTVVENADHLVRLVQYTPVGTSAAVSFVRQGVKQATNVILGDRDDLLMLASEKR